MKQLLLLYLLFPVYLNLYDHPISIRIYNKGDCFIKKYTAIINNKDYDFYNIKKKHFSKYRNISKISVGDIWLEGSYIKYRELEKNKRVLSTVVNRPVDNKGQQIKSTTGKYKIIVNIQKSSQFEEYLIKE